MNYNQGCSCISCTICKSLQTDNYAGNVITIFYRPDSLPDTQPSTSSTEGNNTCTGVRPLLQLSGNWPLDYVRDYHVSRYQNQSGFY